MMNSNLVGCSTGRSAGFAPFKILSTCVATRPVQIRKVRTVRHEASYFHHLPERANRGQPVHGHQLRELSAMRREKGTIQQEQTVGAAHSLECRVKVVRTPDRYRLKPHAERPCSDLCLPKLHLLVL